MFKVYPQCAKEDGGWIHRRHGARRVRSRLGAPVGVGGEIGMGRSIDGEL